MVPGLCLLELRWRQRFWSTLVDWNRYDKKTWNPFHDPCFVCSLGPQTSFKMLLTVCHLFSIAGDLFSQHEFFGTALLHRFFPKNPWWGLKNSGRAGGLAPKKHTPSQGPPQKKPSAATSLFWWFASIFWDIFFNLLKSGWSLQKLHCSGIFVDFSVSWLENWRILWHKKIPPFALPSCHYSAWSVHHAVQDIQKPGQVQFVEFRIRWSLATWIIAKRCFIFFKGKFREVSFWYWFTLYLSCCHQFVCG